MECRECGEKVRRIAELERRLDAVDRHIQAIDHAISSFATAGMSAAHFLDEERDRAKADL